MSKEEKIHKFDIFYKILRFFTMLGVRNFYRKIEIAGKENIPYGSRFIITPNHQNALMDAMAILYSVKESDIVFMARADIFRKRSQGKILTFLKMLPIYRIRDGIQELSKNEKIFERSLKILDERIPVCLMPEGNHGDKRRLRNFVKGAFRIAFRAQEISGVESIKILPVGIDYQHYQKYHQNMLIVFGEPIDVLDFMADFRENQAKALNSLRDRVAEEMKKTMIHIGNEELYDMFQDMRHIWNSRMRKMMGIRSKTLFDKFRADKFMIHILDTKYQTDPGMLRDLAEKTGRYMKNLKSLNMRNHVIEQEGASYPLILLRGVLLLLTSPLAFYGFLNNWLPFNLPVRKTRTIKDKQFHSSFKFVLSLLMFPAFYILQTILVGIITGPAWIAWTYLISLPLAGYFALHWSYGMKKLRSAVNFKKRTKSKDPLLAETAGLHSEIMANMTKICADYLNKIPLKEEKLNYE